MALVRAVADINSAVAATDQGALLAALTDTTAHMQVRLVTHHGSHAGQISYTPLDTCWSDYIHTTAHMLVRLRLHHCTHAGQITVTPLDT